MQWKQFPLFWGEVLRSSKDNKAILVVSVTLCTLAQANLRLWTVAIILYCVAGKCFFVGPAYCQMLLDTQNKCRPAALPSA